MKGWNWATDAMTVCVCVCVCVCYHTKELSNNVSGALESDGALVGSTHDKSGI